jgi:PqqD family protein of HPr-rel-A system
LTVFELKPKVREELAIVEFEGETVVYDPVLMDVHYLNATAGVVFALCDGTATPEETVAEIAEAYGAPAADVEAGVSDALEDFERRGLLESEELAAALAQATDERPKLHLAVPPSD